MKQNCIHLLGQVLSIIKLITFEDCSSMYMVYINNVCRNFKDAIFNKNSQERIINILGAIVLKLLLCLRLYLQIEEIGMQH